MMNPQFNGLLEAFRTPLRHLASSPYNGGMFNHPGLNAHMSSALGIPLPMYSPMLSHPQAWRLFGPEMMTMLMNDTMQTYPAPGPGTPSFFDVPLTFIDVQQRPFMSPSWNQYLPGGGMMPGQMGLFGANYPVQNYPSPGNYYPANNSGYPSGYNPGGGYFGMPPQSPGIPFGDNNPGGWGFSPVQTFPNAPSGPFFDLYL